jgi:hypothetical protein
VSAVATGFSSLASGQNPAHAFVRSSSVAVLFFWFQAIFFHRTDPDFVVRFPRSKFLFLSAELAPCSATGSGTDVSFGRLVVRQIRAASSEFFYYVSQGSSSSREYSVSRSQ